MAPFAQRIWAALAHATEPLLGGLVLNVLHPIGLAGHLPVWVVNGLLLVCAVFQQPGVQRRLTGGDPHRWLWSRLAFHLGLYAAVLLVVDWGPLIGLAFIGTLSIHLRWTGSAAWRPAAVVGLVAVLVGQTVIALGWMSSALPLSQGNAIAAILTVTAVLISRLTGLAVGQREQAERTLRMSEERFRTLVQHSLDVITVTDRAGTITYVSPAIAAVTGHSPAEMLGTNLFRQLHPDDVGRARAILAAVPSQADGEQHTEVRFRHADGSWRWHEALVRDLLDHPAVHGIVFNHRDVTDRRDDRQRLLYEASHDGLTGLANRATFRKELEQALVQNRRRGSVALLYADLDGFKELNDTMGHEAGDALLIRFADVLRDCVRGTDVVARLGGDEFAVLLTQDEPEAAAVMVSERIVTEFARPVRVAGRPVAGQVSVGTATLGPGCSTPDELLRSADAAMYLAKRTGPGRRCVDLPTRAPARSGHTDRQAAAAGGLRGAVPQLTPSREDSMAIE